MVTLIGSNRLFSLFVHSPGAILSCSGAFSIRIVKRDKITEVWLALFENVKLISFYFVNLFLYKRFF